MTKLHLFKHTVFSLFISFGILFSGLIAMKGQDIPDNNSPSHFLGLNYYSTGTGKNITANYSIGIKKNEIGFGLGYTIGSPSHPDDQMNAYYKRQYATQPLHHLNLNLYYNRYVFPNLDHINTFLFYDFQAKHSAARNNLQPTSSGEVRYHGPYYWLDNTIGAGFKVRIAGNWYLQQKFGAGVHLIIDSGRDANRVEEVVANPVGVTWEFIGLLNVGVVYRIN